MNGQEPEFCCKPCGYVSRHRGDWKKHLLTSKHQKRFAAEGIGDGKCVEAPPLHVCVCGCKYKHERNLRRHLVKCTRVADNSEVNELIKGLVIQNERIREQMKSLGCATQTVVNQTIQHGDYQPQYITAIKDSQVNMQIFLNETCNQAINLTSFIESLEVNLEDLDETRERGLAYSIGRVMLRGLKELEFNKRPIHCSDIQKSEMYVRDNDSWDVDRQELRLRNAIGLLSAKQISHIQEWEYQHPNWYNSDEGKQVYAEMVRCVLQPSRDLERLRIENDVIKTLAKETLINEDG